MAGSVNKVILVGNLGADPDIKSFQNGGRIANLRLATSESWTDRTTNERRDRTEWHNVVIDNENLVRVVENYARKGSKLYLEGQLRTRKWQDRDGNDRYTTEVHIGRFNSQLVLLDPKGSSDFGGRPAQPRGQSGMGGNMGGGMGNQGPSGDSSAPPFGDDMDDDVPF